MNDRFFITGLPRSRTAWFAVAAATSGRPCLHEPSRSPGFNPQCWPRGWGISDSGLADEIEKVLDIAGPRTLIIERPVDDVIMSANRVLSPMTMITGNALNAFGKKLLKIQEKLKLQHELVMHVRYQDLTDIDKLKECFEWLGVQPQNLPMLSRMNITADIHAAFKAYYSGQGWEF